jgi:hypothetical protein
MNPNACRVVLRRRGPLEVFDLALRFLRAHAGAFARLIAATLAPVVPPLALATWWTDGHPVLLLVPVVLAPWLQAPATVLAGRLLFAEQVRVRDVLAEIAGRPGASIAATGAWLAPLVLGCGVLSWVGSIATCWVLEVALLEEAPIGRLLRRSGRLAQLHLGVSTSAVFAWYALTAWGALAGESLGQAAVGTLLQLGEPFGSVWDGRVTPFLLLGALLAQPVYGVYHLLLYLDVRTRAESWDLQVALRALGLPREDAR